MGGYHMPRGYGSFLSGVSLMVWSAVGLLTILVSWFFGGTGYKNILFGDQFMAASAVGLVVGACLVYWAQHHGHGSDAPEVDRR